MNTLKRFNPNTGLNRFFDDFLTRDFVNDPAKYGNVPAVNVKENEQAFNLEVALPGIDKKDVNVELDNDVLTISYEHNASKEEQGDQYTRREFRQSAFKRSFRLPEGKVNANDIKAEYSNGVLHITLPRQEEETKKAKAIEIV
jgi:HSP20 family protein